MTGTAETVLKAIASHDQPVASTDLIRETGIFRLDFGRALKWLKGQHYIQQIDEGQKRTWRITDPGREQLKPPAALPVKEEEPTTKTPDKGATKMPDKETKEPEGSTVPTYSSIFRDIGERMGVGASARRNEAKLDPIMYYVQSIADMKDPDTIWRALSDCGVPDDIKKRWLKLYIQTTMPDRKLSDDLSKKMEIEEKEKDTDEGDTPKPKRFTVLNGQVIGDPEGDFSFTEAIRAASQERGVGTGNSDILAAELAKVGPEMVNTFLSTLTPLIHKDKDSDNVYAPIFQTMQTMLMTLMENKHDTELEALKAALGPNPQAAVYQQQIEQLSAEIKTLTDSLRKTQLEQIQETNKAAVQAVMSEVKRLQEQITSAQMKSSAESRYGIMDKGLGILAEELKGTRSDLKAVAASALNQQKGPRIIDKSTYSEEMGKAIGHAQEARALEDELFFK